MGDGDLLGAWRNIEPYLAGLFLRSYDTQRASVEQESAFRGNNLDQSCLFTVLIQFLSATCVGGQIGF